MGFADYAGFIGLMAVSLSIFIPFILKRFILEPWNPKSRKEYAWKFSLWPFVGGSFILGFPVTRALSGMNGPGQMALGGSIEGFLTLSVIGLPVFWVIGYMISEKRFS